MSQAVITLIILAVAIVLFVSDNFRWDWLRLWCRLEQR